MIYVIGRMKQKCTLEINFQNCKLKAGQISELASALESRSKVVQVQGLDLSHNNLNDSTAIDFFSRATAALNNSLQTLFLRSCGIGTGGLKAIMNMLAKSTPNSLKQLDLSFNSLSVASLECFEQHIACDNLEKMEVLILKGSFSEDISINFLEQFAKTLSSKCQYLRRFDLSANKLGTSSSSDLSTIISQFTDAFGTSFDLGLDDDYMSEVENNYLAIMEESIKNKGIIERTIAHGVIVGPGRSGKNTLLKRLMGEGPPDPSVISPSTGVLENVVKVEVKKLCAVASAKCNLEWRKLKYDEEALELMMSTSKTYSYLGDIPRSVDIITKYVYPESVEVKELLQPSITDKTSKQATPTLLADKPESATNDDTNLEHIIVCSSDLAPVDIFKKAVKLRHMDALREHLESSWSLYLTNTGGQIEFQEHLPLLVCGPSIFFVTIPLNHDLDKPYEVQYQYPDGSVKKYSSPSPLIQEILQTLATIYTLDYVNVHIGDEEITLKPTVFLIGTHIDCLNSDSEKLLQIDNKLQRYVKETSLYHQGSIQFASDFDESTHESQLLFLVNNLSKDDYDFQRIRFAVQQTVEEKCYKEFTVQCPSSWLIFSLILREKHQLNRVLRLEDCFKIAQECGISSNKELTAALSFIHSRLGLVRYFDVEGLNSLVVIDPQVLFDKITNLIVETFVGKNATRNEIEDFRNRGIISAAVMKRISERSNKDAHLPFVWLTKLLNHLRLAALFIDSYGEKYFFPSALCHVPKDQKLVIINAALQSSLIAFETGFCPRGISGALIKCLMTNEMNSKQRWYLHPRKIFRNQVCFTIEACGDITLKVLPTHLEIALDPFAKDVDSNEDSEGSRMEKLTCNEAYTQIDKCMEIVTRLYRRCEYFWTFYCTLPECQANPHPAVIEWKGSHPLNMRCKIYHKRIPLRECHRKWNLKPKRKGGK